MWGVDIVIDFIDRVSSGKKIIKYENGTTETVTIENAEDATVEGTPINPTRILVIQMEKTRKQMKAEKNQEEQKNIKIF